MVLKYSVVDDKVMFFVWIAPTQFVKSSNLCQVVEIAAKDGLASVGPNRWMRILERCVSEIGAKLQQLVMYVVAN